MDAATESRRAIRLFAASAGLQAGMLGVFWMLLWLGISDLFRQRSFWTAENLMASAFYGEAAIRSGFGERTLSGLALYLLIYSLLGALLAALLTVSWPRLGILLVSLMFALGWYYLSFRLLWKSLLPLVALLHPMQATSVGHIIYGAVLGRYPAYLPQSPAPPPVEAGSEMPQAEAVPAQVTSESEAPDSSRPDTL